MPQHSRDLERWLPIDGYEGFYEVSDLGKVRSVDRTVAAGCGRTRLARGRTLVQTPNLTDGRLTVKLSQRSKTKTWLVHQLVLFSFRGRRPSGMLGCHNDGDNHNNVLENLRWDTPASNSQDAIVHGRCFNRKKTKCLWGHALRLPNLVAKRARDGHRICLACARARANEQQAALHGRPFDFQAVADAHHARIMEAAAS